MLDLVLCLGVHQATFYISRVFVGSKGVPGVFARRGARQNAPASHPSDDDDVDDVDRDAQQQQKKRRRPTPLTSLGNTYRRQRVVPGPISQRTKR